MKLHSTDNSPNFTSNWNCITRKVNNEIRCGCPYFTKFVREDLKWKSFVRLLGDTFDKGDKVNTYVLACSDGSEAFTLILELIRRLGDKAKKFFPIICVDLSKERINEAKTGLIPIKGLAEQLKLKLRYGKMLKKYMTFKKENGKRYAVIKKELRNMAVFNHDNILRTADNLKPENSVVLCRNVWPYLNEFEQSVLACKLGSILNKKSLCVIGSYDKEQSQIINLLMNNGFDYHYVENVFEKTGTKNLPLI